MKSNKDKKIIIDCICGENRYLRIWRFEEEKEWNVSISYEKTTFWQRLRYIFRVIIKGEDWDEFIISEEDSKKILQCFKENEKKRGIKDLIEMSKYKDANIIMLLNDAYHRGLEEGVEWAKQKAIEAIQNEK